MKASAFFAVFLMAFLVGVVHAAADKNDTVVWHISDFPPAYILSGPNRGQGMGDRRIQIFSKRLPEFHHETILATQARFFEMIKTEPNLCNAGLLKTSEREAVLEFSAIPYGVSLPNGLITTRARMAMFKSFINKDGVLRLDDLLAHSKTRIGIIAERSFGKGIDAALKKYPAHRVVVPSSDHLSARLLKLANQDEFDAVVGYPTELRYLTRELGLNEKDFVFLSVVEESALGKAYIVCSKSPFGKRVMMGINRLLAEESVQNEIAAAYRAWLDDETAARFDRLRKQSPIDK